jgi:hypothetical protein
MRKSREDRLQEHKRLEALLPKVEAELKKIPGVAFVTIALKEVQDQTTEDIVFQVHVHKKSPEAEIAQEHIIPKRIEGVPTDVIEVTDTELHADSSEYRPLIGGCQISGPSGGLGTLGCLVRINAGASAGKVGLLTNHHVLFDSGEKVGDPVGQPQSASDCKCCVCCDVAKIYDAMKTVSVDAAVAVLHDDTRFTIEIVDSRMGPVLGTDTAVIGDLVKKRGRTTEYTEGQVVSVTQPVSFGGHSWTNQIRVRPTAGFADWSAPGDSGSVVLQRNDNKVLGLHFAGAVGGTAGYANHIANVQTALNVTVLEVGTAASIPLGATLAIPSEAPMSTLELLRKFEAELEGSVEGRQWVELFHRHWNEIQSLINSNRAVQSAWHRNHGPAFIAHFVKSTKQRGYRVPEQIGGVMVENLIIAMGAALQKSGSPELAMAVRQHHTEFLSLMHDCRSLEALAEKARGHTNTVFST